MACLYCGKRVSMVRQMADPDFCSDDHRKRYHEMARAALSRLGDFEEEAPGPEPPPSTPDVYAPLPEPPRQTIPMSAGARRRSPQAPGPRLVVTQQPPAPPPPPMCDLYLEPASANDFEFALRHAPEVELLILPVFYDDALAAVREAISARGPGGDRKYGFLEIPPALPSAAMLRGALRLEPAICIASASDVPAAMLPAARALVRGQCGPFSFFIVEPRPRRRFARWRSVPPPRVRVDAMVMPHEPAPFAVSGVASCGALPHRLASFAGAAAFTATASGIPERAVFIPSLPGASPRVQVADAVSTAPAGMCGFRKVVPHVRRGELVPVLAARSFGMMPATLPLHTMRSPKFGRTPTCGMTGISTHAAYAGRRESLRCSAVFDLQPVWRVLSPLPPARRLKLAESSQTAALRVRAVARLAGTCLVQPEPGARAAEPALPAMPAVRISGVPAAAGIEEIVSVPARYTASVLAASGGITARAPRLPVFNPRIRRGRVDTTNPIPVRCRPQVLESVPMDGFGGMLRAPGVRIPGPALGIGKHNGLPVVGHEAARPPKVRLVSSRARFEEISVVAAASELAMPGPKGAISASGRIEAGRVESKGVTPSAGLRKAVWTAVAFEAIPAPATRAVRAPAAGKIRSGGEMRYGAPRAQAFASVAKPGAAPFVAGPVSHALASAAVAAAGVSGSGLSRRELSRVPATATPQMAGAAFPLHAAALPVLPAEEGVGKAAGLAVPGYRESAPMKPFAPSSSFHREPRPAPPFHRPELRLSLPIPAGKIRRALERLDLQPAGAVARPLDCRPALQPVAFRHAGIDVILAGRTFRLVAAGTIASGKESRLRLTAPARLARLVSESGAFSAPGAVMPGARSSGPAGVAGVGSAGILPVSVRSVEHSAARQAAVAAVPVLVRARFTPASAISLPGIRAAARPYAPGIRPGEKPAAQRRDRAAQPALCFAYPEGVFIVPVNPRTPPVAGYPLFAFTYFEVLDFDDHTIMVTRCVEELLPVLVIPESKPVKRAQRLPLESGTLTGFIVPQAGDRGLVPFGAIFPRGGKRFLPVLDGEPDTEDRDELLAAAGSGGGMWRFFR